MSGHDSNGNASDSGMMVTCWSRLHYTRWEIDSESQWIKPNFDFNCTFPIDLASNEIPLDAKSIGNNELQSKFGLIDDDSVLIFMFRNEMGRV